jgi:hypothetical protein
METVCSSGILVSTNAFPPGGKAQPGHDADHSPPSSDEVMNE